MGPAVASFSFDLLSGLCQEDPMRYNHLMDDTLTCSPTPICFYSLPKLNRAWLTILLSFGIENRQESGLRGFRHKHTSRVTDSGKRSESSALPLFFFQEIKKERSLLPSLVTHPFDTQQVETSSFSWDEDHGALSFLFVKSGSDI